MGIGIGILSWFIFLISNKPFATSTTYAKTRGMIEKLFRGEKVAQKPYYKKINLNIDWQYMLVIGIVLGSFLSAMLSGNFNLQWVPNLWASAYGTLP